MIEKLTEDERGALDWFGKQANRTGRKALRIMDAYEAELATLRESHSGLFDELQKFRNLCLDVEKQRDRARAENERLRSQLKAANLDADMNGERAEASESRLAETTKLPRWQPCPAEPEEDDDGPLFQGFVTDPNGPWVLWEDLVARLANQPAAPAESFDDWAIAEAERIKGSNGP